jgi:hypothetical protein
MQGLIRKGGTAEDGINGKSDNSCSSSNISSREMEPEK